jgi:quinol-cytochrome oxidoreductase complex cytochrome b subunit
LEGGGLGGIRHAVLLCLKLSDNAHMRKKPMSIGVGIIIGCVVLALAGTSPGHPWMEYGRIFLLVAVIAFFVWMWTGSKV